MTELEKETIKKQLNDLNEQRNSLKKKLDRILIKEDLEKINKQIGKCYAFPNSYGYPSTEKWTMYVKILDKLDTGRDARVVALKFQQYPDGSIEIKKNHDIIHNYDEEYLDKNYMKKHEISKEEFEKKYLEILSKIEIKEN